MTMSSEAPSAETSSTDSRGDDVIYGLQGNDVVYGGSGEDTVYGGPGADTIYGGAGWGFPLGQADADSFPDFDYAADERDSDDDRDDHLVVASHTHIRRSGPKILGPDLRDGSTTISNSPPERR